MYTFEDAARDVAANYGELDGNREAALGDGTLLALLIELLPVLIDAFENCQSPAELRATARKPRLTDKALVRLKLRRELGRKVFRREMNEGKLMDALFKTTGDLDVEQIKDLYEAE